MSDKKSPSINLPNFTIKKGGIAFYISAGSLTKKKRRLGRSDSSSSEDEGNSKVRPIHYWGMHTLDPDDGLDNNKPIVKFNKYEDLELTEEEKSGYLTDRIIASCSSYLDKNPETLKFVLCKCLLRKKGLNDISILYYHHYLQHLDLSSNNIDDLSALGGLPYLIYLDASNNKLTEVLNFKPSFYLTFVNLSHNDITHLKNLSEFWALKTLNLSHNKIQKIEGLDSLQYLETLDLSYNKLKQIENLNKLNIINLNLHYNDIKFFVTDAESGFKTMKCLSYVRLDNNSLTGLEIFENALSVQSIYLENNKIKNLLQISYLKGLPLLVYLDLTNNPVTKCKDYKMNVLATARKLNYLDQEFINLATKLEALSIYEPDISMQSIKHYATLMTLSNMTSIPQLDNFMMPCDKLSNPIVMLVSPVASRAETLVEELCILYPDTTIKLITHTTKKKHGSICEDNYYYYISNETFASMALAGDFAAVYEVLQENYGISYAELFSNKEDSQKVIILCGDIYAALTLRMKGFCPWLILALPRSEETHNKWLMETYSTIVYNKRYPEGAIKVARRDDEHSDLTNGTGITYSAPPSTGSSDNNHTFNSDNDSQMFESMTEKSKNAIEDLYIKQLFASYSASTISTSGIIDMKVTLYTEDSLESDSSEQNSSSTEFSSCLFKNSLEMCEEGMPRRSPVFISENIMKVLNDEILKVRQMYLDFHNDNPGIFYETLFTDEMDQAIIQLKKLTEKILEVPLKQKSNISDYKIESYIDSITKKRLHIYEQDISRSMKVIVPCTQNI